MKDLSPSDFTELIGTQITIDNPHDDLPPHILTLQSVNVLLETDDERRNAFAVNFVGSPMIGNNGQAVLQGLYTVQGGPLEGKEIFISVNGYAEGSVDAYEYEAILG